MFENDYFDDDEITMEDAYDEGYMQALIDMGIDPDDIAEEDVDIFDDDYFEGVEGAAREYRRAQNKGKSDEQIHTERYVNQTPIDRRTMRHSGRHDDVYGGNPAKRGTHNSNYTKKYNMGDVRQRDYKNYRPSTKKMAALYERMRNDPSEAKRIEGKVNKHFASLDQDANRRYSEGSLFGEKRIHQG